ncbi:GFA family protein [Piscinibacter sp. XHJ-5]|uniref:GFA family protein n=1 Tax=Piscinibacter sp. XHJ-5 TaxID=3037797 RepID=UPI0024530E54|nr:GFA family protein [Piscinibacter sp. XHJ-5]
MAEPTPLTGGCLCGSVRYEATPDDREGYYCHCRMCQLAFGNTRVAWFNLPKDRVRWLSPPTYFASSKIARRGFCNRCGTPLSFEYHESKNMDIGVGSLDDPSAMRPVVHYSIETRLANWHADDGLPGKRLDEVTTIADRWKSAYGDDVQPGVQAARKD